MTISPRTKAKLKKQGKRAGIFLAEKALVVSLYPLHASLRISGFHGIIHGGRICYNPFKIMSRRGPR